MYPPAVTWNPAKRIAFRFAFASLGLFSLALLALSTDRSELPPVAWLWSLYWRAWGASIAFLSKHLLGFTPTGTLQGSDSQTAWMKVLWTIALSALVTIAWTLASKRGEYTRLFDRLRTLVRHSLAATLFVYGFAKLFGLQFWTPNPVDLAQTYAASSPFALAWRFMGYSATYTFFGGVMECVAGALLLWRRTTLLGALVTCTVMVNVVALNFCYAIPVKNISLTLLAFALFLLLPELRRLAEFLVWQPATPAPVLRPFPASPRAERVRRIAKAIWIAGLLSLIGWHDIARLRRNHDAALKPRLWGLYDVEELRRDGVAVPLVITDARIWQQVAFGKNWVPSMTIITVDGERHRHDFTYDPARGKLTLEADDDSKHPLDLRALDATHMEMQGDYFGENLQVRLRFHDLGNSTLVTRPFHWIDDGGFYR